MTSDQRPGLAAVLALLCVICPVSAGAQERPWSAEAALGYAGLIDDATKDYLVVAGAVRRYLSPRLSVGPELVLMHNSALSADRAVMATGNVTFDFYPSAERRQTPFVIGGFGVFASRERFPTGPFWSSDPAFTAGGGVRAAVGRRTSLSGEYRLGWELHHRITGTIGVRW